MTDIIQIQERPMNKFKHDLLKQMKVLKNGHYMLYSESHPGGWQTL